uniref:Arrestin C-terminal-like domain-containing protein n=1 Tax=Lates calcarifer TaxID=8187 RepID=A0A4W6G9U7_LATCA
MSSTVKSLKVTYNPNNEQNTFTSGDWVSGQVALEVAKDCQIESLSIKFKGKAEVLWTERHGQTTVVYHSKDKYFSLKHYFIRDKDTGKWVFENSSVVAPGCHVYPFTFQIPHQHQNKRKKLAMDVDLEKTGFFQGERLKVVAHIQNNSSREIKPKYCVYRKHSFFANGKRKLDTKDLLKEVGEPIPPSSSEKVVQILNIPHDMEPSILNCNNIKAEHRLRVYLDVKYASDPEIKFPIIILRALQGSAVAPPPTAAGFGFEPFGNPNPPAWGFAPPPPLQPAAAASQPFDPPPPYGPYHAPMSYVKNYCVNILYEDAKSIRQNT